MKSVRTWIVIADGSHARAFENTGPGRGFAPIVSMTMANEVPAGHDILADRPGRAFDSHGQARHAMENRSDPRREMKRHFAGDIAARLAAEFHADAFDRLMIAAAPAMLGDLRRALSSEVRKVVAGEIAKDLTKTPEKELPTHFDDMLAA